MDGRPLLPSIALANHTAGVLEAVAAGAPVDEVASIDLGVDVLPPGKPVTALVVAALHGNAALCVELIGRGAALGGAPCPTCSAGPSPLDAAAAGGHLETVRLLLRHGAPVNGYPKRIPPVLHACAAPDPSVLMELVGAGADVHAVAPADRAGAAYYAAMYGSAATLTRLSELGVEMDAPATSDFTPLDAACACGNVDAVRVLGAMGADLERRGTVGWKVSRNRVCCCEDLGVMCSWRQGTDTVLVAAVLYENKGVARALLEAGADPGARQGGVGDTASTLISALGWAPEAALARRVGFWRARRSLVLWRDALVACRRP